MDSAARLVLTRAFFVFKIPIEAAMQTIVFSRMMVPKYLSKNAASFCHPHWAQTPKPKTELEPLKKKPKKIDRKTQKKF
jgi:hypothetical protein